MAGSNSGGGMMIVVLIGGVCCLSLLCSGGVGLFYAFNEDFKRTVNGWFGIGGNISSKAGELVCPDTDDGTEYQMVNNNGVWWCEHPERLTRKSEPNIANNTRASKLPSKAIKGKTYDKETLSTQDGNDGEYGPNKGWGFKGNGLKYTAP